MNCSFERTELPQLQSSCSPESPEVYAQPTKWQKLRAVAQSQSLLPANAASKALLAYGGNHTLHVASSPLDHLNVPVLDHSDADFLRQPAHPASAKARLLLKSQHVSGVTDSLDADLQVEAVLRKAASRAAHMAGMQRESSPRIKSSSAVPLQPPVSIPAGDHEVPHFLVVVHVSVIPFYCLLVSTAGGEGGGGWGCLAERFMLMLKLSASMLAGWCKFCTWDSER